ncbi:UDP-glucose dehydrogenase family protein [Caldifermentibacillus hisashii]|uniref:UDP-glucose dehydrogenase family protein n=1 Tax=Caldifermentibacillus hisashii TaxID=996558 RepID=UPI000BA400AD|nr:UDP-glucose/GDP-mannose dehydrogenase family protein [Caldifermentibacillus hisashii]PAC34384.1 UDP-glucose 6-dehydrogenase [Caldifermentibacillus hisashii]
MKISIIGTGYVGLVTGVALSHIGHHVTCIDIDETKVEKMRKGISPIYEPGLEELMKENIQAGRLFFTTSHEEGFKDVDVIYIAVGTPEKEDGSANLMFVEQAVRDIAANITKDVIVVTKSTVPVGTNHYIKELLVSLVPNNIHVEVVSNPEFLREGSSVYDTFHGDRIVIGADQEEAGKVIEEINKPFGIPIFKTDIKSAEMIKYVSNAFLATKISFINEIANICEKLGADIESVAKGMGMDKRIGSMFLNAGIGYGGSCFPKDTKALTQIAANIDHNFELLKAVIKVNNHQQRILMDKAKKRFGSLTGKKVVLLGLSFKPNTDDMREAASIIVSKELIAEGAEVVAYDPVAVENAKKVLPQEVVFTESIEDALENADMAFILTEWAQIKELDLNIYVQKMKQPIIFDGRNCYNLNEVQKYTIEYHSIGRKSIYNYQFQTI